MIDCLCSRTNLNNKEIQIKITLRFYHILVRIAKINKANSIIYSQGCWEMGKLNHCWWKHKLVKSLWKSFWTILKKLKIPTILQKCICSKNPIFYYKDTCVFMIIPVLVIIMKNWKVPGYPSTDEWIIEVEMWCFREGNVIQLLRHMRL